MKKISALLISYEFPPIIGGAGVFAHDLAIGLSKNNCKVDLVSYYHDSNSDKFKENLKSKYNIDLYFFKSFFFFHLLQFSYLIFQLHIKKKYDIIILSDGRAKKAFSMFGRFINIDYNKSVSVFHGNEIHAFFNSPSCTIKLLRIDKKFKQLLFKQKILITVSKNEKQLWRSNFPELKQKIRLVNHGISEEIFYKRNPKEKQTIKNKFNIPLNQEVIISASRLVKEKGQDNVIKAFSMISDRFPNAVLCIIGEGNYLDDLKELSVKFGCSDKILFMGGVSREILSEYLSISTFFILTSRLEESFGLVYLEAAACGVTSISGNIGGVKDVVINNRTGLQADSHNVNAIKEAMVDLLTYPERRKWLANNAYRNYIGGYTNKISAKNLLDAFYTVQ